MIVYVHDCISIRLQSYFFSKIDKEKKHRIWCHQSPETVYLCIYIYLYICIYIYTYTYIHNIYIYIYIYMDAFVQQVFEVFPTS